MTTIAGDPLFLIGNQRSGTTWVGNVLNRSPDIMYFFEPFEKHLGLFDNLPDEATVISNPSPSLIATFRDQYHALIELNGRHFPVGTRARLAKAKWTDIRCNKRWGRAVLSRKTNKQLSVINQWHSDKIVEHLVPKNHVLKPFIKETRLHHKLPMIYHAFPSSRVLLLLRHPYPVVFSILRWFARGRLQETRTKLEYMFDIYQTQDAVIGQCPEAVRIGMEGELKQKLVAHWFILNDLALKAIKQLPEQHRFKIATYESICKDPPARFHDVFSFFSIDYGPDIQRYVQEVSMSDDGLKGIVDTRRKSTESYDRWMKEPVDREIIACIEQLAPGSEAYACVQKEYDPTPGGHAGMPISNKVPRAEFALH